MLLKICADQFNKLKQDEKKKIAAKNRLFSEDEDED